MSQNTFRHDFSQRTLALTDEALAASPLGPGFADSPSPVARTLAMELAFEWQAFLSLLKQTALIRHIEQQTLSLAQYRSALVALRHMVADGPSWMSRAASSMEAPLFALRAALVEHAAGKVHNYKMLDKAIVQSGGSAAEIGAHHGLPAHEALTAYIFGSAGKSNPVQVLGAVFILEGLGVSEAGRWGALIKQQLLLGGTDIEFFAHYGRHGDAGFDWLRNTLQMPEITADSVAPIVRTAAVVGQLLCRLLEESIAARH